MPKERILITVKTYPTLSRKYGETVCTAGVREDGSWVRLYPIPFRLLDYSNRYSKYDWIETSLVRSRKDPRPESHHPVNPADIKLVGNVGTDDKWRERRRLILKQGCVHSKLQPLIDAAHTNKLSLAIFKPARIVRFTWAKDDRDWDPIKIAQMRARHDQGELFAANEDISKTFALIPRVPYTFSYRFADVDGKESEMQILDWEAGQLYWNCRKRASSDAEALEKVKKKYADTFANTDLNLFLGTTQQYHGWATNPWVIIGVFPIPREIQLNLL